MELSMYSSDDGLYTKTWAWKRDGGGKYEVVVMWHCKKMKRIHIESARKTGVRADFALSRYSVRRATMNVDIVVDI
jgi:hypothetical protein